MKQYRIWVAALLVGIVNAFVFRGFELAVDDGTNGIWNNLFKSNSHRWVVIPLAIVFSIIFSYTVHRFRQKRYVTPDEDLLDSMNVGDVTLVTIGVILLIGLVSLLAGASLGPEAPLMASSAAIGTWAASRAKLGKTASWLVLASVGSLLVAFFGSILPVLIPMLLIYKRQKKIALAAVGVILVTGVTSFITLHLIDRKNPGYGSIPAVTKIVPHDFVAAFVVGFITTVLALGLRIFIKKFAKLAKRVDIHLSWPVSAALFGLGLGLIYLFGGQTTEFSGSAGTTLLLQTSAHYTTIGLAGLVLAKLLATGWSKATGYRGGLVFPSIYVAVALSLTVERLASGWSGPGVMIGGVAGMLSAVTGSPIIAAIFVASLLPSKLFIIAIVAIGGTVLGTKLLDRLAPAQSQKKA